ncbi:sulfur carrier protein ThiS [bacterium]|nr:sulfur carrier protein ThiS [bacterium]MCI6431977.1 sulfur carrier protein ThiS [Lachnospiraceae bacterium]MCI7739992.1 sulfur carrier protein ThiS [Lachnospiraceae bacterium]MDY3023214.1 sulfur carrier protein ThiS [Oliverpabstia sp.]MDY5025324.1 sulfur carrier protein ThiS [Oliverpabstia sp.]
MVTVNGKSIGLSENITVSEYLKQNQYRPERIAIELNGSILPKSAYNSTILKDGDVMEIVSFVGGG